jgi:hypothetical protein
VDRADEVEAGIALRRQRHGHLTLTELGFGFGGFIGHATTMTGKGDICMMKFNSTLAGFS